MLCTGYGDNLICYSVHRSEESQSVRIPMKSPERIDFIYVRLPYKVMSWKNLWELPAAHLVRCWAG
jgi:hypothetical protein